MWGVGMIPGCPFQAQPQATLMIIAIGMRYFAPEASRWHAEMSYETTVELRLVIEAAVECNRQD